MKCNACVNFVNGGCRFDTCTSPRAKVIAIDYDETLALNSWPGIGEPNWTVINRAKIARASGAKLILWTCRSGEKLAEAVEACRKWGLEFDAVNDNTQELKELWNDNPRKIAADVYVDDKATPWWLWEV